MPTPAQPARVSLDEWRAAARRLDSHTEYVAAVAVMRDMADSAAADGLHHFTATMFDPARLAQPARPSGPTAGWASPGTDPLFHWWSPAGRQACGTSGLRYQGAKTPEADVPLAAACLDCANAVREAVGILGPPR